VRRYVGGGRREGHMGRRESRSAQVAVGSGLKFDKKRLRRSGNGKQQVNREAADNGLAATGFSFGAVAADVESRHEPLCNGCATACLPAICSGVHVVDNERRRRRLEPGKSFTNGLERPL